MKIEQKPAYVPFTQQPYCCVPAVIQMIFYRRSIPLMSQEDIGWEVGLIVPEKSKHQFKRVRTEPKPPAGYGTQVHIMDFSMNKFFKKYNIPLQETLCGVEDIKNMSKFIIKNLEKENDLIACFYDKERDYGHVCLIESCDTETENVTLVDPEQNRPKRRSIALSELASAMKAHGKEKGGGIWLIEND